MEKGAGGPELDGFGGALADMMVTDLSHVPDLQLVERLRLQEVLGELELSSTAFIDPASAQTLGHGLGAQLVVMGSFSVVGGTLVIDTRMIAVETAAVVTAARAEGAVADFVSIEKEVTETLVEGLDVELSRAAQRQMLLQTPTEDFDAFASYGLGMKARDQGQLDAARAAFENALKLDPEFSLAASELAALRGRLQAQQASEAQRRLDARATSLQAALAKLTPETSRPPKFKDTLESRMDLGLRLALLARDGQHCTRFDELRHHLVRKGGELSSWINELPGKDHQARYQRAGELLDLRAEELGLRGQGTLFGTRPHEARHAAGNVLATGPQLWIAKNMQPEKFSQSLVASLERCFPPEERPATWEDLRKAQPWPFMDDPLYRRRDAVVTLTVRDAMDLYGALLRAESTGIDPATTAVIDAVLARHPEGDLDRASVLSRVEMIVYAGESTARRPAARLGMSADALEGAFLAVRERSAELLHLDAPDCAALITNLEPRLDTIADRYERVGRRADIRQAREAPEVLAQFIAPVILFRCHRAGDGRPWTAKDLAPKVRAALARPNPHASPERCSASTEGVESTLKMWETNNMAELEPTARAPMIDSVLSQLYNLQANACLLP